MKSTPQNHFADLVEAFFLDRLIRQRNSSPQTIAAYRDCFRLLFQFARERRNKLADTLALADLNAPFVLAFLDHLEKVRKNSVRSRNARLAAIRSFLRFAVLQDPQSLALIQRTLAIPLKRHSKRLVGFLLREEVQAIVTAPDASTWAGQRDQTLLATLYNTGARVSEVINIMVADLALDGSPSIRLHGKGRKDRTVPIWPATALQLRRWITRIDRAPDKPLFPTSSGCVLTRSAVTDRLRRAVKTAAATCPSVGRQRISPHTFRHYAGFRTIPGEADFELIGGSLSNIFPA